MGVREEGRKAKRVQRGLLIMGSRRRLRKWIRTRTNECVNGLVGLAASVSLWVYGVNRAHLIAVFGQLLFSPFS